VHGVIRSLVPSEENIVLVANELIEKLTELNNLIKEHGLKTYDDVDICRENLKVFLKVTKGD